MSNKPQRVNEDHFSTEKFPEIIAFCERDESTRVQSPSEESYAYLLNGQTVYILKKFATQWELAEMKDKQIARVSTGRNLGMVLMQGLHFTKSEIDKQEERVNILIPVDKTLSEKALALMYYYGGYPGNFFESTPEMKVIVERFIDPDLAFLSYSYVPVAYIEWLREILKQNEIIQEGVARTLWMYKK